MANTFNNKAVDRIRDAVKKIENMPNGIKVNHETISYERMALVQIGSLIDVAKGGQYAGFFVKSDNATYSDYTNANASTGTVSTYDCIIWNLAEIDVTANTATNGNIYNALYHYGLHDDITFGYVLSWKDESVSEKPIVLIYLPPPKIMLVDIEPDGGVAGSSSTNCTFTYKCFGTAFTGLTPVRPRYPNLEYEQTASIGKGLITWAGNGVTLIEAYIERPKLTDCAV